MKDYARFHINLNGATVYIVCWTNHSRYSTTEHAAAFIAYDNGQRITSTF